MLEIVFGLVLKGIDGVGSMEDSGGRGGQR